jgi:hypothetical protein
VDIGRKTVEMVAGVGLCMVSWRKVVRFAVRPVRYLKRMRVYRTTESYHVYTHTRQMISKREK